MTAWQGSTRGPATASRKWRDLRKRILARDNYTCQHCGGELCGNLDLEVDHRIPDHRGGTDHPDNLQTLGRSPCHDTKTARERTRPPTARRKPEAHPGIVKRQRR